MKGDNWETQAACGADPDAMFPGTNASKIREAQAICAACPVRKECLEDAMRAEGNAGKCRRYGIRGGLTPTRRRRLHEQRSKQRVAA